MDEMEFARSACAAAQNGNDERLRQCLERNPMCIHHDGASGSSGYTPLHYAARGGHAECIGLLLRAKASVHARTSGGATPLMRAAFAGHASVIAQLLRAGSSVEAQDSDGDTALHKAASQQHEAAWAVLLQQCQNADAPGVADSNGSRIAAGGTMALRNRQGKIASDLLR